MPHESHVQLFEFEEIWSFARLPTFSTADALRGARGAAATLPTGAANMQVMEEL
jgi:hypothetical protein